MKKFLIIGLIVSAVLIVVGGAGSVIARAQEALNPQTVTVTTTQNGDQIIQQFGPNTQPNGKGIMINPGNRSGDDGILIGPGRGGMMGQYVYQNGPKGNGQGYGPGGMMGGFGPGFRMGGRGEFQGFMHDYMISAFANAVGLTVDQVNTRLSNGETPQQIAIAQGKTEADLPALWTQVRTDALKAAVADGVITQAQADVMLQHMNNYSGPGFGPGFGNGNCPMWDGDENQQP
jgi:hypothetical protein